MRVQLANADAAMAESIDLRIDGISPGCGVQLSLALEDENGEIWSADASFAATSQGSFDLAHSPSLDGSYTGVDPAGLLWSALPKERLRRPQAVLTGEARGGLMPQISPLAAFEYELTIKTNETEAQAHHLTRRRLPHGVSQTSLPTPLAGTLFEPAEPNGVGVLVIGGSEGGLFPARAAQLAGSGFTTIALAYFDYPGRPKAARAIAIEYFGEALAFLRAQKTVKRAGVIGVSRGSEAAQLLAISQPEAVDALLCWVPSHLIHRGFDMASGEDFMQEHLPMWVLDGEELPGIDHLPADCAANETLKGDFLTTGGRRYRESYKRAWSAAADSAQCIVIERYPGPILAVAGRDDALWPADLGAQAIIGASPHPASTALILENAGHLIGTPNEPRPFPYLMQWGGGYMGLDNGFCAYGGTREGSAIAARASWRASIDFLRTHCL
ncbi:MAG: acyl-CoA thioesterase/bile acid-CoA:amino acid N-acyltransferase family protein [Pseudomonadota bacterium]